MVRMLSAFALVTGLACAAEARTIKETYCPPMALGLVLDASGSIGHYGHAQSMIDFAVTIVDVSTFGPSAQTSLACVSTFNEYGRQLAACSNDFEDVKSTIRDEYVSGGMTAIGRGVAESIKQLDAVPDGLAKVMLVVSDGRDYQSNSLTPVDPVEQANAAKAKNITLIAVGFAQADVDLMQDMASCPDCTRHATELASLQTYLLNEFCVQVNVEVPTPAPTPVVCQFDGPDRTRNKDAIWDGCVGDFCKNFLYGNGSNEACVYLTGQDGCDAWAAECSCTCRDCCDDPTPAPTPPPTTPAPTMPGDTFSPTSVPTPSPTTSPTLALPPCPLLNATFETLANWVEAKKIISQFLEDQGYNFTTEWQTMVDEYRVRVLRNNQQSRFTAAAIVRYPFEPFTLQVWMPASLYDKYPEEGQCKGEDSSGGCLCSTGDIDGGSGLSTGSATILVPLLGLLFHHTTK